MAIPRRLVGQMGRSEVKLSLRTSDPLTAKLRTRFLSNALDVMFRSLAGMPQITTAAINERVRAYFQDCLNETLEYAAVLPSDPKNDIGQEVAYLRESVERMQAQLAGQTFSKSVRDDAEVILQLTPEASGAFGLEEVQYARSTVLRAKIERDRILAAQLSGHYDETLPKDPLFVGMEPTGFPPLPGEAPSALPKALTLRDTAALFLAYKAKHDFAAKTTGDVKRVLALAYEIISPEKPIKSVDTNDIKLLRDLIASLPPNYMKGAANAGIGAKQASEENQSGQNLSLQTQEKYLRMFKSVLSWASDEGYVSKIPGAKIKVAGANKIKAIENRHPYSTAQLQEIFGSPLYVGCKSLTSRHQPGSLLVRDGKFWTPIIALYSGMRMGEIVQLLATDLKKDDNVWFFDVSKTEGDGKKIKTLSSVRRVPIHASLIEIGLLKAAEKATSKGRLFPDIECGSDGYYSHNFSKWWGRYSRHVKFFSDKTAFHSFRHNFKDALSKAQVPEAIAKALMGHADGSVHGQYGSGPSITMLKEHIDRISYPIDSDRLRS